MGKEPLKKRGIYDVQLPTEEEKKINEEKIDAFVYRILEMAEEQELTVAQLNKIHKKLGRYIDTAEYSLKYKTKYNAPGCYLW